MERLHREIKEIKDARGEEDSIEELRKIMINNQQITVPANFLKLLGE
jgi:putative GTP pyrophosphokinase